MSSVALVIMFNQDFSNNIGKLELLYSSRFSKIDYLVPSHYSKLHKYYTDDKVPGGLVYLFDKQICALRSLLGRTSPHSIIDKPEAIKYAPRIHAVVGDQFYFYHFIYQAAVHLLNSDARWFWFLGDDAILNKNIDEHNMLERLGVPPDADVVLCCPVISDDPWLEQIAGSVTGAKYKLKTLLGTDQPYLDKMYVERENAESVNKTVCVACADFFGVSRRVLQKCLPYFKKAQNSNVYVELAVPNILTYVARKPTFIREFDWIRNPTNEELNRMIYRIHNSSTAFVHPVKLSMMDEQEVVSVL